MLKDERIARVAARIAGDIVMSDVPGETLRKWREFFGLSQTDLARRMGVSPSVVSDYEKRKRSPGARMVRKFVESLIKADLDRGGKLLEQLGFLLGVDLGGIILSRELPKPVEATRLVEAIDGEVLANEGKLTTMKIYGYTVLDAPRAILAYSGFDFVRIFGSTTARALIFTGTKSGRSTMVAVRVAPLKPRIVVIHGPSSRKAIDELSIRLAVLEGIPYVLSKLKDKKELLDALENLYNELLAK